MENQSAHRTPRSLLRHGGGGREDCWSEGATETLIEAWGDRFVLLNRGNLRQKDWKEIADDVNSRQNGVKPRKTDVQCKNRVDTLKKKYKLEKSKSLQSRWPFYYRIDSLIGPNAVSTGSKKPTSSPSFHRSRKVTFTVKLPKDKLTPNRNPNSTAYSGGSSPRSKLNSLASTESSLGGGHWIDDDDNDERHRDVVVCDGGVKEHRMDSVRFSHRAACRELAGAILEFGEIYERVESSKQEQMMELERQRMEFTKDLEFRRLNIFMETKVELEKMKRSKICAPFAGIWLLSIWW